MNQSVPLWTTLIAPVATLLGTMLVVMLGVYLQNRALEHLGEKLSAKIGAVRSEIGVVRAEANSLRAQLRQELAQLELRLTKLIRDLTHRVDRLEEARGLVRTS